MTGKLRQRWVKERAKHSGGIMDPLMLSLEQKHTAKKLAGMVPILSL